MDQNPAQPQQPNTSTPQQSDGSTPQPVAPVPTPQPAPVPASEPVQAGVTMPTSQPSPAPADPTGPPPIVFPQQSPQPDTAQSMPTTTPAPAVAPVASTIPTQAPEPQPAQLAAPASTPEPTPAPSPAPAPELVQPAASVPQPEPAPQPTPTPEPAPAAPVQPASDTTSVTSTIASTSAPNTPQPQVTESLHATATMPGDPSHPEEEHHSGLAKLFTILLVIILLAGIGFAAYAMGLSKYLPFHMSNSANTQVQQVAKKVVPPTATPTPDPTASWSTYTNAKYAYSLKYPAGLTPNEVNTYYHYVEFKDASSSGALPPYLVSVIPSSFTTKNAAAYNFMSSDFISALETLRTGETTTNAGSTFTKLADTTVGGNTAFQVGVSATGIKQARVYVKAGNYIYMLLTNYQNQNDLAAFNLLLSTFKLTK